MIKMKTAPQSILIAALLNEPPQFDFYCFFILIKCAIDGIVFFCSAVVALSNAPVGINRIFEKIPLSKSFNIFEHNVDAQQPHPEPPA